VATERVIDLEHSRYADREYAGPVPESAAAQEARAGQRRADALARLCAVASDRRNDGAAITGAQLRDLLTVLGLDE
jgi:hypothetical protein